MQGSKSHCNPNKEFRITLCISPEGWRLFQSPVIMNHKPQTLSVGTYTCRPAQFWPGFLRFPPGLVDLIKVSGPELEVITIWLTKSYCNISLIHQSNSLHVSSQLFIILLIISNHPKPSQYTKTTGALCGVWYSFSAPSGWVEIDSHILTLQLLLLPINIHNLQLNRRTASAFITVGYKIFLHPWIFLDVIFCCYMIFHRPVKRWEKKRSYMI